MCSLLILFFVMILYLFEYHCVKIMILLFKTVITFYIARECLSDDDPFGLRYRGTMNTTKCGYSCQRWDAQSPHRHYFSPNLYTEENFCRNPGDEPLPWCYTTDPDTRFEFCARLKECGKTIFPFGLSLIRHFWGITFQLFE